MRGNDALLLGRRPHEDFASAEEESVCIHACTVSFYHLL